MMASPFPGMDPYLEPFWGDVHSRLVIYAADQLQVFLPRDLRARVEERVFVESPTERERVIYPDVRVIERGGGNEHNSVAGGVAVAEPIVIHAQDQPVTQRFLEITDPGSKKRVVTVIEFLSPSNKHPGEGRDLYLEKQRELKLSQVSLVEIDLLRGGKRVLSLPGGDVPAEVRTTYQICVRRGSDVGRWEVYLAPLRERLPTVRIPLRRTDMDVPLDLQALINQCYRNGGYDDDIDYRAAPEPPLEPDDGKWADELLRGQGRR